ncbi:MAG: type II toxin-antitoxin system RelB/DinJ family antitoxin [Patescibacteria group bacterium]
MNTTLTIKTPKKLRDDAKKTAREMGVPLTTVMNSMLKQFVRDRRLVLEAECPYPSHTPNAETRKAIRELRRGGGKSAATTDEMFEQILGKNLRTTVFRGA